MLLNLHIKNVAVIDKLNIEFTDGFNALTGETGAGKSIVIDSIGAVLGERVSRELVRRGAEKAQVTAVFDTECAEDWLRENEIDAEDEQINTVFDSSHMTTSLLSRYRFTADYTIRVSDCK